MTYEQRHLQILESTTAYGLVIACQSNETLLRLLKVETSG